MSQLGGRFNDGLTAASRAVVVRRGSGCLEIADEGGLVFRWQIEDLSADPDMPASAGLGLRNRVFPDSRLMVADAAAAKALLPELAVRRGGLRRILWGGAAVAASALVALGLWHGLPVASQALAALVPTEAEQAWGDRIAASLTGRWKACETPAGTLALGDLADRVAQALPPGQRPRRVVVVDQKMVNAFALPGGTILILRGLIDKADGPDEVAGVLAHEAAHVALRHPLASAIRGTGVGLVVALIGGDPSGLVVGATAMLVGNAYTREDEAEADRQATRLLDAAGIDRKGLAAFFRRLAAEEGGIPEWLSTHPEPASRAEHVETDAATRRTSPALSPEQWRALKAVCG